MLAMLEVRCMYDEYSIKRPSRNAKTGPFKKSATASEMCIVNKLVAMLCVDEEIVPDHTSTRSLVQQIPFPPLKGIGGCFKQRVCYKCFPLY